MWCIKGTKIDEMIAEHKVMFAVHWNRRITVNVVGPASNGKAAVESVGKYLDLNKDVDRTCSHRLYGEHRVPLIPCHYCIEHERFPSFLQSIEDNKTAHSVLVATINLALKYPNDCRCFTLSLMQTKILGSAQPSSTCVSSAIPQH